MGCDPITFRNVNSNVMDSMKQKLANYGIHVPSGNEGEMEGYGVKGHFKWDGTENLTLTITDKPFLIPCEMIINRIQEFVHSYGGVSLLTERQL
jgi:hypothetical protein